MDETQFREILRLGLGRAILYAQLHDLREFRAAISDACLHCYSCFEEMESTRAAYMHDLVSCLPDKDSYYNEVLKSLAGSGDDWDAAQRFHFAACLAFDGNEQAKRAMYDAYHPGPRTGELIAVDFLKMDGIPGLLFVAEKIGALLQVNPEEVDEGFLLNQSLEICGEQSTWDALRDAGATNAAIETYRLTATETRRRQSCAASQRPKIAELTYEQVINEVPANKAIWLGKWGQQANDEELERAASGLVAATDSKQQLKHLRLFARRRFPLDVHTLLALVDIEQDRVGSAAVNALTQVSHPEVRALAFRLMRTHARRRGSAIRLMAQNYEHGDHGIVLRWFQEEEDHDTLHSLGGGLLDFWKRHPDDETELLMLRSLYERVPCSFCRERAVRRFIELAALPDELRAECAWDANYDIRELVNPRGGGEQNRIC